MLSWPGLVRQKGLMEPPGSFHVFSCVQASVNGSKAYPRQLNFPDSTAMTLSCFEGIELTDPPTVFSHFRLLARHELLQEQQRQGRSALRT